MSGYIEYGEPFWTGFRNAKEIIGGEPPPPEMQHLLAIATMSTTWLYDVEDMGDPILTIAQGGHWPRLSPDGEWLLVGQNLYSTRSGDLLDTVPTAFSHSTSFSHDRSMAVIIVGNTPTLVSTDDWQPLLGAPSLSGYAMGSVGEYALLARNTFAEGDKYLVHTTSAPSEILLDITDFSWKSYANIPNHHFTTGTACTAANGNLIARAGQSVGYYPIDAIGEDLSPYFIDSPTASFVSIMPGGLLIATGARGDGYSGRNGGFNIYNPSDGMDIVFSGTIAGYPFGGFPGRATQVEFTTNGEYFIASEGMQYDVYLGSGRLLAYRTADWSPATIPVSMGVVAVDVASRILQRTE